MRIFAVMRPLITPPWWLQKCTAPWLRWSMPAGRRTLYLSFDDGPHPEVTPRVLDVLAEYQARASFFVMGERAENQPAMMNRMLAEGHTVACHGYHHLNGFFTGRQAYVHNVTRCRALIPSPLFRPPYGRIRPDQALLLRKLGYELVMWTLMSMDYASRISPQACLGLLLERAADGHIMVFHDSPGADRKLLYALPRFLKAFGDKGFHFAGLNGREQQGAAVIREAQDPV